MNPDTPLSLPLNLSPVARAGLGIIVVGVLVVVGVVVPAVALGVVGLLADDSDEDEAQPRPRPRVVDATYEEAEA